MDPYDSPAEAEFRAEARAFLAAHADPLPASALALSSIVAEWTPEEEVARLEEAKRWQAVKQGAGWAGISWPTTYGGRGGSLIENLIFQMEESEFDVPHDALLVGLGWCGPAVMLHGTDDQRERLLPPLLRGDEVWCQLFSEPGAGSDLAGLPPGPSATATSGCSTGRRSGPRSPIGPTADCASPDTTPRPPATPGSPPSSST